MLGGEVSLYGGSRQTFTPSFDYGGSVGNTEYFVTARGNWNALGLENPTPNLNAEHDYTEQDKFFAYSSTLLNKSTRFSLISAASYNAFQIPSNPNQMPLGNFGPTNYSSSSLNENEYDTYVANIATLQKKGTDGHAQFAVFSRYAKINFMPDVFGDLVFNDVASNVTRESLLNGTQFDASYLVNDRHTFRAGFAVSEEQTNLSNISTVLPVNPVIGAISPTPFAITDLNSKLGWNIGTYTKMENNEPADAECRAAVRSNFINLSMQTNSVRALLWCTSRSPAPAFTSAMHVILRRPIRPRRSHPTSRCSTTPPISRKCHLTTR